MRNSNLENTVVGTLMHFLRPSLIVYLNVSLTEHFCSRREVGSPISQMSSMGAQMRPRGRTHEASIKSTVLMLSSRCTRIGGLVAETQARGEELAS